MGPVALGHRPLSFFPPVKGISMYRNNKVTTVRNRHGEHEAAVFRGKCGFYFLDLKSDALPIGPFKTRERAEISADICCDTDRWCRAVVERERREIESLVARSR